MTKQEIIDEIKRTAMQNGGVPLGAAKFFSITGIKESTWVGKYWARWSDAVREAGFIPNKMKEGYDSVALIEILVPLIRKLGRFPTANDMRLWNRNTPGSPNVKSIFNRLGPKKEMVAKVFEYCRGREALQDIAQMCAPINGAIVSKEEISAGGLSLGYVYLIKSGRFYKIGKTNSIGRREYELAIQLPEKAQTVHSIETDDPTGIEVYWHGRFESKRKNGEWFELQAPDVQAFRKRKFM